MLRTFKQLSKQYNNNSKYFSNSFLSKIFNRKPKLEVKRASEASTVIIGGGMAGLVSAAYLSKAGFPVTLLEQNNKLGGCMGSFTRMDGKYTFEQSLHATNFGLVLGDILKEVGAMEHLDVVELDHLISRHKSDTFDISIPSRSPEEFLRIFIANFPQEEKAIRDIYAFCTKLYKEGKEIWDLAGNINKLTFPFKFPNFYKIHNKTLGEVLSKYTKNEELISAMFATYYHNFELPVSRVTAIALFLIGMGCEDGQQYLKGTSQQFATALEKVVLNNGGEILYGKQATEIKVKDNVVEGVKVDEEFHSAKIVVSNVNPITTFQHLIPENSHTIASKAYLEDIKSRERMLSVFIVFLGLNEDVSEILPHFNTLRLPENPNSDEYFPTFADGNVTDASYYCALYNHAYPGYAKPNTSVINIYCIQGYKPWKQFEEDYKRGEKTEYRKKKEEMADILVDRAERDFIPGLKSMIEYRDIGTPLTVARFTGNIEGTLGFACVPELYVLKSLKNRSPINGLYMASGWIDPGMGYIPTAQCGRLAYNAIKKDCPF